MQDFGHHLFSCLRSWKLLLNRLPPPSLRQSLPPILSTTPSTIAPQTSPPVILPWSLALPLPPSQLHPLIPSALLPWSLPLPHIPSRLPRPTALISQVCPLDHLVLFSPLLFLPFFSSLLFPFCSLLFYFISVLFFCILCCSLLSCRSRVLTLCIAEIVTASDGSSDSSITSGIPSTTPTTSTATTVTPSIIQSIDPASFQSCRFAKAGLNMSSFLSLSSLLSSFS